MENKTMKTEDSKLRDLIRELIKQSLDEVSGTGGVAGYSTPFAFTKKIGRAHV